MGRLGVEHRILLSGMEIHRRVIELAQQICIDYRGQSIVLVGLLKGAFMFLKDLGTEIERISLSGVGVSACYVDFLKVGSYGESRQSGMIKLELDMSRSASGMHVIIVEDVADTLNTLAWTIAHIRNKQPSSLRVCVLLAKPDKFRRHDVLLDYVGFERTNTGFLYGYGMDLEGAYRALSFIAIADSE